VAIIEKGVGKNVSASTSMGARAVATTHGPADDGSMIGAFSGFVAGVLCAVALCAAPIAAEARPASGLDAPIAWSALPPEAQQTDRLIRAGGPFPYSKDGVVFGNREKRLERRPRGYYHEYTVPSPGSRDRGARRIVCGGVKLTEPDGCFYTEDHYNSFHRIVK
jgi:ribonuclease T1